MTAYQLTGEGYVIRDGDTKVPTVDTPEWPNTNPDYLAYKQWLAAGGVPLPPDPPPAVELRTQLVAALADEYEARMRVISAVYPPSERESWPVQTAEARALLADPAAATPWIDAAAAARGINRVELAARIVAKDEAYRVVHGLLTGVRQAIEDRLDAAGEDASALQAIDITGGWPPAPL
ncbi:hypothetical protein [Pulveribacter sp.]|uniref:hypothetical protein n=1 Tax=Pulveribacter sp. TaxID=2678893 RepID=UPI0028A15C55|nr:hypothetical protein [Pulveribacter sp.]